MADADYKGDFNHQLHDATEQESEFHKYLSKKFDRATAGKVVESFQKMGLPAPQNSNEFLDGTEGGIVFLNKYGLVIRIEYKDTSGGSGLGFVSDRINDSPWIIQPVASIDAGKAIIEICPGCHFEKDKRNSDFLYNRLSDLQIKFWDEGTRNTGKLPIKNLKFPEGIPVVIDRLAVKKLSDSVKHVSKALRNADRQSLKPQENLPPKWREEYNDAGRNKYWEPDSPETVRFYSHYGAQLKDADREAGEAQKNLYAPLREAFDMAWNDSSQGIPSKKMKPFWELCSRYVREEKLIAGWNDIPPEKSDNFNFSKTAVAVRAAESYGARLKADNTPALQELNKPVYGG